MSILLNLTPEIEMALINQAQARGVAVDAYVESLVEQAGAKQFREGSAYAEAPQVPNGSHAPPDTEQVRRENGAPVPHQDTVTTSKAAAADDEARKEKFRAGIEELARQARELDTQHPPQENPNDDSDPYMQVLLEKYRRQGFRFE